MGESVVSQMIHFSCLFLQNLLIVKEAELPNYYGGIGYLGFEKLTFVPIQNKLVDLSLLSHVEINWLNDYHAQVWEKVSYLRHLKLA
ncbi:hypothetical protein GW17_00018050 [Ensete ventricosum]|nr:hypothetical protein GW17_00018050 [Ensete ventricosum]RZR89558.1 hypothetical protein BHM03_00017311 [Ensete ventricosum]